MYVRYPSEIEASCLVSGSKLVSLGSGYGIAIDAAYVLRFGSVSMRTRNLLLPLQGRKRFQALLRNPDNSARGEA
jgi:hypothetical protein